MPDTSLPAPWIKSSYSGENGDCTEARHNAGRTDVRDSKRPHAAHLSFDSGAWSAFLGGLATPKA